MEATKSLLDSILGGGMQRSGHVADHNGSNGIARLQNAQGKNLADVFSTAGAAPSGGPATSGGGLGGILGGLLGGGAAGSILTGGLGDLLKQFQQTGHGDKAASWVSTGPNQTRFTVTA
jgi:uncharacterized protein YidB (DUF937 family)